MGLNMFKAQFRQGFLKVLHKNMGALCEEMLSLEHISLLISD